MNEELIKHIILNISIENPEGSEGQELDETPDFDEDDIDSIESEVSQYWVAINRYTGIEEIISVKWDFESGNHLMSLIGFAASMPIWHYDLIAPIDLDDYLDDLECSGECEDCDCGD